MAEYLASTINSLLACARGSVAPNRAATAGATAGDAWKLPGSSTTLPGEPGELGSCS